MKKFLSVVLSLIMMFTCAVPVFAQELGSTTEKYPLGDSPYADASSTVVINEDGQQEQVSTREEIIVKSTVSLKSEGIWAEVFLTAASGDLITKVEADVRLYVNGLYVASETISSDPLLPVLSLQAGGYVGDADDVESGDLVTVYFDGTVSTLLHGDRSFYQVVPTTI